jgi:iron complex outermembrane receptor protein
MKYRVAASSLVALSFALMQQAGAQTPTAPSAATSADVPAPDGVAADPADPAAAASPSDGIQDIVVTATRRETNLQKTPIAISVVNAETIRDRHVQSLLDLADGAVPSLRVATFEARQSALTVGIRGIVPFDANQTARDQGVGVYIDGVYMGRQQGLNAALFDVQRIEVLRGPQGTLFGRNTEGGALNIVTVQPSNEFSARVLGGIANYGGYNGEAHVNVPLTDTLAVKLDGVIQHQDAFVDNPLDGAYGWGYFNRVGGRASAKWEPLPGLTLTAAYDEARDENTPFYSQLINYNPRGLPVATLAQIAANGGKLPSGTIAPLSPLVVVSGPDERMDEADIGVPQQLSVDQTHGFVGKIAYKVSPALELRSITAWRGVTTSQWDNSGGAHRTVFLPNAKFSRYSLSDLRQTQFSQELQAVGSIPQLDYVAGLYYFNEHAREAAATPSSNQWNADGTDYLILSPTVTGPITSSNQGWDRGSRFVQRDSRATAKSYAAFAQATFTPEAFDALHLTVGGRYTKDKRDGVLTTVQNRATDFRFRFDEDRFDPMVTLAYDATPDINLYAKYATGYRAGGANSRSQTFSSFGPESVKSYEIGAKTQFWDRRVRLNLAGYIMDRKGTQIDFDNVDTNPNSPTFNLHTEETRNAPGISKIRGVEAELTVNPMQGLTLGAGYAYTYTQVPATPNPFLNNALYQVYVVYTPPSAANASIDYEFPVAFKDGKVRVHLDGNYADAQYSFQNEPVKTQNSFIVNGRLALADLSMTDRTKATLSLWTRNLFDETHIYRRSNANALVLGDYANFNPPRTFGLEVSVAM